MNHAQKVRVLYKTILRLHRGLPVALQELGNNYVKEEFKRHKTCSPMESQKFMSEWAGYAINLAEQLGIRGLNSFGFSGVTGSNVVWGLTDWLTTAAAAAASNRPLVDPLSDLTGLTLALLELEVEAEVSNLDTDTGLRERAECGEATGLRP
uniref:Succinate dehydrogenase assembly factor 3 n=1 Tax=Anopheles epiroticus TaxID=199890 RepID=A0A182PPU3_9DIPT